MKSSTWDYDNPGLICNQVKSELEKIDMISLTEEEREWVQETLWFWYHHAISCAIRKGDKATAQKMAEKAVDIQPKNHPNQITQLLYYLVHDNLEGARVYAKDIQDEMEQDTAEFLMKSYESSLWPLAKP